MQVYIQIEGYNKRIQGEWERTRLICFYTAAFGNSDPKKFPKTPQKFMPFAWDENGNKKMGPKEMMERYYLLQRQKEGGG